MGTTPGSPSGTIQSRKDFKSTPEGQYKFWYDELNGSEARLRDWGKEGTKIVMRYKGGSRKSRDVGSPDERSGNFRLNLFHSNVFTLQSMLYGNLPNVDVKRKNLDSNDDVGRVAAEIIKRVLNADIQDHGEEYNSVLKSVLQDRLLPGLGCARVRYAPDMDGEEVIKEEAPVDYFHWRDVSWGWARTFSDIPWIGFRSYLNKDEVEKRFGKEAAEGVQLEKQAVSDKDQATEADTDSVWQKAAIWEIWDKVKRKVVFVSVGYDKVLETKDDFLGLSGFYPCPPFLIANATTSLYIPTSDFYLAQDLYNEIDLLQTRISIITEAVKVVGLYDKGSVDISRMFKEGTDNDLIPVENWALFAERGGIAGQIDWVPIADVVNALDKLIQLRDQTIGLLQQITGMTDLQRGQLDNQYEGVGQSEMKAKFGSIRVQSLQEDFATFATDLMQIKAEVIALHFDPKTIAQLANVASLMEADQELVLPAIELIKQPEQARLQVEITAESLSMMDYAQVQSERTEYLMAVSKFMQASAPLVAEDPRTKPYVLQLLQWGLAGFKGSGQIEGVIDQAIEATMQEEENPVPDPAKQAADNAMALEQAKHENNMKELQAKSEGKMQEMKADMDLDIRKRHAELMAELQEIAAKMRADIQTEISQSMANLEQNNARVMAEIQKKAIETALDIEKAEEISDVNIKEDAAKGTKENDS